MSRRNAAVVSIMLYIAVGLSVLNIGFTASKLFPTQPAPRVAVEEPAKLCQSRWLGMWVPCRYVRWEGTA